MPGLSAAGAAAQDGPGRAQPLLRLQKPSGRFRLGMADLRAVKGTRSDSSPIPKRLPKLLAVAKVFWKSGHLIGFLICLAFDWVKMMEVAF